MYRAGSKSAIKILSSSNIARRMQVLSRYSRTLGSRDKISTISEKLRVLSRNVYRIIVRYLLAIAR